MQNEVLNTVKKSPVVVVWAAMIAGRWIVAGMPTYPGFWENDSIEFFGTLLVSSLVVYFVSWKAKKQKRIMFVVYWILFWLTVGVLNVVG